MYMVQQVKMTPNPIIVSLMLSMSEGIELHSEEGALPIQNPNHLKSLLLNISKFYCNEFCPP